MSADRGPRPLADVLERVRAAGGCGGTTVVAVDGPGGAGKSTIARALAGALEERGRRAEIVAVDDFYLPTALRPPGAAYGRPVGGDVDWPRLRDQVLLPLREGREVRYARYDWTRDALAEEHAVRPGAVVIVEGVHAARRELASLYDVRVWVECPRELRLRRGLARDGANARARWEEEWMPAEDRYAREHRPQESADCIVDGSLTAPE